MEIPETNSNCLEEFINHLKNQIVQEENKLEKLEMQVNEQQNKN